MEINGHGKYLNCEELMGKYVWVVLDNEKTRNCLLPTLTLVIQGC